MDSLDGASVVKKWLREDPTFEGFRVLVQRNRLTLGTAHYFAKCVKRLCGFLRTAPPSEALRKIKVLSPDERVNLIDDFVQFLIDGGVNSSTIIRLVRGGVKKWLMLNDTKVDWLRVQQEILPHEERVVSHHVPLKKELRQILNVGDLRDRVMILCLISSGLRVGTIGSLTLGDFDLEKDPTPIIVKRKPSRKVSRRMKRHVTFITPEAKKMLLQYIEHRKKMGENITEASPLLTSDRKTELGRFLSPTYLSHHWRRVLKRAHLATKNGRPWHDIHTHTLRKFFETQVTNAGVKNAYREFWMGHAGAHLEASYFGGETEAHKQEYLKARPYLSVLEETHETSSRQMRARIEELQKELQQKTSEIEELRREMEKLKLWAFTRAISKKR